MTPGAKIILCSSELAVPHILNDLIGITTIAFVRVASKACPDAGWVEAERSTLVNAGHLLTDIFQFDAKSKQLLREVDSIFLCGGNTFSLLSDLRDSGVDRLIIESYRIGKVIVGESAGAVVLCPNISPIRFIDDPQNVPSLTDYTGLNLVPFFPGVHFGRSEYSAQYQSIADAASALHLPLLPLRDNEFYRFSSTQKAQGRP